jgi:hypothetical protein
MDMKRHNCFFISMLVDKGKEWDSYKMEIIIRKSERLVIQKVNRKRKQLFKKKKRNNQTWKWEYRHFWNCLWNGGPWTTIRGIPKNSPYTSSDYPSLKFSYFADITERANRILIGGGIQPQDRVNLGITLNITD